MNSISINKTAIGIANTCWSDCETKYAAEDKEKLTTTGGHAHSSLFTNHVFAYEIPETLLMKNFPSNEVWDLFQFHFRLSPKFRLADCVHYSVSSDLNVDSSHFIISLEIMLK